jgi:uncharacterized membrane protein YkoI
MNLEKFTIKVQEALEAASAIARKKVPGTIFGWSENRKKLPYEVAVKQVDNAKASDTELV